MDILTSFHINVIIVLFYLALFIIGLNQYFTRSNPSTECDIASKKVAYSKALLEFLNDLIITETAAQFKTIKDGKGIDRITEANVKNIAMDISKTIYKVISYKNGVHWDCLMFDRDYLDQFIINTTIQAVKGAVQVELNRI